MIVIKTEMKKMPRTCKDCSLSDTTMWGEMRYCKIKEYECPTIRRFTGHTSYIIPHWCPLIEIDTNNKEIK